MEQRPLNSNLTSEQELYDRIATDPEWVFDQLFKRYSSAIFGHLLQLLPTREDAEEVLQEAFIKIWKNLGTYDSSKGRLFTWMLRIARNTGIDLLRKNKMKKTSNLDEVHVNKATEATGHEDFGLMKMVNGLSEERAFVVNHLIFKGYTQQEVADEFDIPLGTVKSRFRAAMQDLRKLMSNDSVIILLLILSYL